LHCRDFLDSYRVVPSAVVHELSERYGIFDNWCFFVGIMHCLWSRAVCCSRCIIMYELPSWYLPDKYGAIELFGVCERYLFDSYRRISVHLVCKLQCRQCFGSSQCAVVDFVCCLYCRNV